jgi:hypothetical protein
LWLVVAAQLVRLAGDVRRAELAVRGGHRDEFHAEEPLCRACLVRGDVSGVGADDGVVAAEHQGQADHVGACAVEDGESFGLRSEHFLDLALER